VQWPGREATSAKVKNVWSYRPTSAPPYALIAWTGKTLLHWIAILILSSRLLVGASLGSSYKNQMKYYRTTGLKITH